MKSVFYTYQVYLISDIFFWPLCLSANMLFVHCAYQLSALLFSHFGLFLSIWNGSSFNGKSGQYAMKSRSNLWPLKWIWVDKVHSTFFSQIRLVPTNQNVSKTSRQWVKYQNTWHKSSGGQLGHLWSDGDVLIANFIQNQNFGGWWPRFFGVFGVRDFQAMGQISKYLT